MGLKSYFLSIGFWSRPWFVFSHMVSGSESQTRRGSPTWGRILLAIATFYFLIAYLLLPRLWKRHETHLAIIKESFRVTQTSSDIPGDPLNIALVGTEEDVIRAMTTAGWDPADPLTFRRAFESCSIPFCENRMMRLRSAIFIFSDEKKIWLLKNQLRQPQGTPSRSLLAHGEDLRRRASLDWIGRLRHPCRTKSHDWPGDPLYFTEHRCREGSAGCRRG
jgi:LssY C-terminus